ncbi:MAG: glutathione peroxidase [Paraglaciecola sp.]|nr:glutathione peroxidase [Paraglaciecola sp.]
MTDTLYHFNLTLNNGQQTTLEPYQGKVLLIVNTASKCGFTPQYEGLQRLYSTYHAQGLVVLGFPCDQFGHQEPGSDEEIEQFCSLNFNVNFPLFRKFVLNGSQASPLYTFLKSEAPGVLGSKGIKWNFTKFLVDKNGKVIKRYAPTTKPTDIITDIEALLAE